MSLDFGDNLSDHERRDLLESAHFWLGTASKDDKRSMFKDLYACFDQWKLLQVGPDGKVEVFRPITVGMLLDPLKGRMSPAVDLEPWQCAGPHVHNEVDLAFKLWLDSYPPFEALLERYGVCKLFAACGLVASKTQNLRAYSLVRLSGFLTRHLAAFASIAQRLAMENLAKAQQRKRQDDGLRKARAASARSRREKAQAIRVDMRRIAVEYFRARPGDGIEEVVPHIQKYVKHSATSIRAAIKGAKSEALRTLNGPRPK